VVRWSYSVTGGRDFAANSANCVSLEVIVITLPSASAESHIQAYRVVGHIIKKLVSTSENAVRPLDKERQTNAV